MNTSESAVEPTNKLSIEDLEKKNQELVAANTILKANISTLFRTAKAEIARKDQRIAELQSELDDLIFKRMKTSQKRGIDDTRET